jgi:hypothetical protein
MLVGRPLCVPVVSYTVAVGALFEAGRPEVAARRAVQRDMRATVANESDRATEQRGRSLRHIAAFPPKRCWPAKSWQHVPWAMQGR